MESSVSTSQAEGKNDPSSLPSFKYKELPESGHFRCIYLYPATNAHDTTGGEEEEQPIECELAHAPLPTNKQPLVSCVALSYTWGGQARDQPIICGHGFGGPRYSLKVTQNCLDILRALRRTFRLYSQEEMMLGEDSPVEAFDNCGYFWIDQICIDQDSEQDRNLNVGNMGRIYQHAASVLVWLGFPPAGSSNDVAENEDVERFLLDVAATTKIEGRPVMESLVRLYNLSRRGREAYTPTSSPELDTRYQNGIRQAMDRHPWFSRMWTFQEYQLATGPRAFLLSSSLVSTHVFLLEVVVPRRLGHLFIQDSLAIIQQPLEPVSGPGGVEFWNSYICSLLWRCINRDCSDPRDKIYALRGVLALINQLWKKRVLRSGSPQPDEYDDKTVASSWTIQNQPPVEYSKPVVEVYMDWTAWAISDLRCTMLLYLAPLSHGEKQIIADRNCRQQSQHIPPDHGKDEDNGLRDSSAQPSWVPRFADLAHLGRGLDQDDWMRVRSKNSEPWKTYEDEFSASGHSTCFHTLKPPRVDISTDRRRLFLTGIVLHSEGLRHLSPELPPCTFLTRDILEEHQAGLEAAGKMLQWVDTARSFYNTVKAHSHRTAAETADSGIRTVVDPEDAGPFIGIKYLSKTVALKYWRIIKDLQPDWLSDREAINRVSASLVSDEDEHIISAQDKKGPANLAKAMFWTYRCHLIQTTTGRYGFGFGAMQEGDVCAIVAGMTRILVLRPSGMGCYRLVGHAYVNGVMDGEMWPDDESLLEEIVLV